MAEKFNPNHYESLDELPEEQKPKFEIIEGGEGFVLKGVEKNPETAHRLAIIEDRAINILQQEVENNNLDFDNLLRQYTQAADYRNYEDKRKTTELLRQISDLAILRGGDYDPKLKEEFKKRYEYLWYSNKLQDLFIENLDPSDIEVMAKVLQDEKFTGKHRLIEKIKDEDLLWKLYKLAEDNLNVTSLVVGAIINQNPESDLGVRILKDISDNINNISDQRAREEKRGNFDFNSIRTRLAEMLIQRNRIDTFLSLLDGKYFDPEDVRGCIHKITSDQVLYELLVRCKKGKEAIYIMKFIADKDLLLKVVETNGEELKELPNEVKASIVEMAKKLGEALETPPEIFQADELRGNNKFIVGVPSEKNKLFIGWSNTDSHEYHKDIFESMSGDKGVKFPKDLRSGGYIEIEENDGRTKFVFCNSSGDFGNYSQRILEFFRESILKALIEKTGKVDAELVIETSR